MKFQKILFSLPLIFLSGCASFQSGDIRVSRQTLGNMLDDKALKPFAEINIAWKNFPYKSASDSIGIGSITNPPKPQAFPVKRKDINYLKRKAEYIFAEAGLYDPKNGEGALRIDLVSFGKWTYRDLFKSFLVDTGWIMILPASLRVNYHMLAEFEKDGETVKVEETARHKTTFHALIFPLYPFFSPGIKEKSMLKNMLWKCATDIYTRKSSSIKPKVFNSYDKLLKLQFTLNYFPKHLISHSILFDSGQEPMISLNKARKQLLALINQHRVENRSGDGKPFKFRDKELKKTLKTISDFMDNLQQNGYAEDERWQSCVNNDKPISLDDWTNRFACYHCAHGNSSICN